MDVLKSLRKMVAMVGKSKDKNGEDEPANYEWTRLEASTKKVLGHFRHVIVNVAFARYTRGVQKPECIPGSTTNQLCESEWIPYALHDSSFLDQIVRISSHITNTLAVRARARTHTHPCSNTYLFSR